MRRFGILVGIVLVAGVLLVAGLSRVPAFQDRLVERIAERVIQAQPPLLEGDGLRVLLCGSSGPLPHPTRAKPCVAVFAGGRFYLVDAGPGSWNRLAGWRIPGERIAAVLLTHFHSDHIGELGEIDLQTWAAGRPAPLRVYGPPGVERVVAGFEAAYALDAGYRTAHHGAEWMVPALGRMEGRRVALRGDAAPTVVLEEDGLRITAFPVDHAPVRPAYGYRFDYQGRSVVVSGDTARSETVVEAARSADVLFHEAQANHLVSRIEAAARAAGNARVAKILSDIPDYHTSPVEAAEIANQAGVKLLILYHLTPPPPVKLLERAYVRGVSDVARTDWRLGDDGLFVELPAGSDVVRVGRLD
jgi:ribonuclease Z